MNDHTAPGPPAGLNPTDPEQDHAEAHIHPASEMLVTDRAHRLRELVPAAVTIGLGVLVRPSRPALVTHLRAAFS